MGHPVSAIGGFVPEPVAPSNSRTAASNEFSSPSIRPFGIVQAPASLVAFLRLHGWCTGQKQGRP